MSTNPVVDHARTLLLNPKENMVVTLLLGGGHVIHCLKLHSVSQRPWRGIHFEVQHRTNEIWHLVTLIGSSMMIDTASIMGVEAKTSNMMTPEIRARAMQAHADLFRPSEDAIVSAHMN